MQSDIRRPLLRATIAGAIVAAGIISPMGPADPVRAAGTPDISLQADSPGGVVYGAQIPITLSVTNPTATDGYNLSFHDVLPVGVSFVSGSSEPAPTAVVRGDGTTALFWTNVSDLLAGTEVTFTYRVLASDALFDVDDTVATTPSAFVNSDPRFVPDFDDDGDPIAGPSSYTGNDSGVTSTTLLPFELTKSEPNTESELLRGVHEHQTVYTIRVDNNLVNPSSGFAVVDHLPAGLEFLGCGTVDNTTVGEEYPPAGPINPGNAPSLTNPCLTPSSVTTVTTDPDGAGPLPDAVYTRVEWNTAALASVVTTLPPSGSFEIDYVAAIPLRENVQAALPDPTANLDNNTGALTADEQQIANYVTVTGTYNGRPTPSTDAATLVISAEDVSIHKSVSAGSIVQGASSTWTLLIESSEYATSTGPITVTDTIPDGLDFVSSSPTQDAGFPVTNGDGTLTVQWTLAGFGLPSSDTTITFGTTTRADYRATGAPVAAGDSWTNTVALVTDATIITANSGAATELTVDDESSAGQEAGGLTVLKEVSAPATTLTCGDGTGVTFEPIVAGEYRPGDRVCWRLSIDFPSQLDTLEPIVQDILPPGFAYDSWAVGTGDTGVAAGSTFGVTSPVLTWNLGTDVDLSERFEVVVQSVITDPAVAADGDLLANLMKFRYKSTDGRVFQLRDEADVSWAEPELTLDKGVIELDGAPVAGAPADNVTVQNGEVVTYQVRVANDGTIGASSVDVRDVLPVGIACSTDITAISDGGTCGGGDTWIEWSAGLGLTVPAGGSLALNYDLTVPLGTSAQSNLVNTAGVRTYDGPTNDPGNPTFEYVPSSNIDPTLVPNTDPAIDPSNIRTGTPTITKTRTTSITEAGNAASSQATIGETITYTVTVNLPGGTAYYGPATITDVVNATRLDLDETSLTVTLDGAALPAGFSASTAGSTVTITFPGDADTPYQTPTDDPQTIVATFGAVVTDVTTNVRPTTVPNRADFGYDDAAGNSRNISANVSTQIVEPNLTLAKTNGDADGVVDAGQVIDYTVTVANPDGIRVATAHDIVVVDTVPVELTVLAAPGDPAGNGDTIAPDGGIWDSTARTITWNVASINPATSVALDYQAQTADPLVASGPLTNAAVALATGLAGADAGERDSTTTVPGYRATATDTVVAPTLAIAKSGTPDIRTVGETVTYTVDLTIPGGVIAYDVTVIDDLPPGIEYESLTSVTCDQGGPCAPDISSASVTADGDVVAFFLGDQTTPASADRVVTITYVAYLADVAAAAGGAKLTNGATAYFNGSDVITGNPATPPEPGSYGENSDTATDDTDVVEPALSIDKNVAGQVGDTDTRRAEPGDTLTFDVTVTNAAGPGSGAAHDITISDTPDPRLTGYTFTPVAGVVNSDADPSDGTLVWTVVGPLAPGASITIVYTLTVPVDFDSSDEVPAGAELTNTADVPSYFGVDATTRTTPDRSFREYGGVGSDVIDDTVDIELDLASIGDLVWFDVDGDGVVDAGEPPLAGVDVVVTYLGANGVLGGGDDETVTVSTDADGRYLVDRLPGGNYRVDVLESDPQFIAGLVPSYDRDGGTATPNGLWLGALGEADDRRDVDFGYTGDGSIGDTIWFDRDGGGIQDAGEAGIPGVDVVVTWFGPDGTAGGGDDVVYPIATTDAGGNYLVGRLPAGDFSVAVQADSLPAGYSIASDPQGAVDGASLVTLSAGADDLDQDFGYRGSGSIGDTIYLDRNADGDQDIAEPGLAGVTVVLDHAGPDGIAGNADDSTFTTVTDADGNYLFDFLPPGPYTVTVTGGLPANVANSDDPDGGADSIADLVLGNGADDLDQDFGYAASSVLGDRVWWDLDSDGVQDPGEPGLDGISVTATGPNGLSFSTVTSGDGGYLFSDIPDGDWSVTLTAGVPAGMAPTFDADGTGTPGTSDVTLAMSDLTQDFGYASNSSIGDRLWLDHNGDGVQEPDEPGIEDVLIELTWYGPDAAAGGGDDIVVVTSTDADGNYRFVGLPAGEYSAAVDDDDADFGPDLVATFDRDGTTVSPDGVAPVTLGASEDIVDVDFGYRGVGAIGDLVWFDRDGDGVQDADEPGLSAIDVTLVWYGEDGVLGTADDETFTTVTDADGAYGFAGLPPGTFDVTVDAADLPAGMQSTFDVDGGLDDTSRVVLADGQGDLDQDFGYQGAGSIGDTVYLDLDGDGIQSPGEPGIPGQTVTVVWAGPDGAVEFTTATDGSGNYLVDGLPDGDFTVTMVGGIAVAATNTGDPDGGGDSSSSVTLTGGAPDLDQDFGYRGANAIGDLVWWDRDADGTLDGTETGLPGVEITVTWFGVDGVDDGGGGDDLTFVTTTTVDGNYLVGGGLPDGSYRVDVTDGLPVGLDTPTYDEDDGAIVPDSSTVVSDLGVGDPGPVAHVTADFAFAGSGSIGDRVWLDLDGDRTQDAGEPGIPGVTVILTWAGLDGDLGTADDVVYPDLETGPDGDYLFEHLPAGDYRVDLDGVPAGLSVSADPDGAAANTSNVTLAPGEDELDQDFGYVGDASVGDSVWLDVDADGVQDPGEPGLPGIAVTVTTPGSDGLLGTPDDIAIETLTDADGRYLVGGLPGVAVTVTYDTAGLGEGLVPDSDLDGGDPTSTSVELDPGDAIRNVDYGIVGDASLTGVVYDDRDGDGVQDSGEVGIPGVDVTVVWDGPNGPVTLVVTTDGDGRWGLTNLPPGDYEVTLEVTTLRDGDVATTPIVVSVVVPAGGTATVEHGATAGAAVGDRIWNDSDRDGVQDPGEPGLSGVRVTLTDAVGSVVDTATTDGNGGYRFDDLVPGRYTVTVDPTTLPGGYAQTGDPDASLDGRASVVLVSGTETLTVDFGYAAPRGSVPRTGSDAAPLLRLAALAVVGGLLLVGAARRRRAVGMP